MEILENVEDGSGVSVITLLSLVNQDDSVEVVGNAPVGQDLSALLALHGLEVEPLGLVSGVDKGHEGVAHVADPIKEDDGPGRSL